MTNKQGTLAALFAIALLAATVCAEATSDMVRPAPNFVVENFHGCKQIDLAEFADKVVYVDFWASWCGPCLRSFPFMQELHETYADKGLVIIAINLDRDPEAAREFLDQHPVGFLIGENSAGDVAEQYDVVAMPSSYIIGRDGNIKEVHYGFKSKDREDIAALIRILL